MATEATESKAFEPVLSLKWTENGADIRNTFQPLHLWEQFNDMRINRTYCDVDIVLLETSESAPVSFSVHSCIVALSSTLFKRILSKDCMRKKITLQSVRRKSIETCIKYMYGQEVHIAFEDLDEIALTASRLQMKFLQLHCQALRSAEQNSDSDSSSLEKSLEPKAAKGKTSKAAVVQQKSTANNSKTAKDTPSVVKNNTDKKSTNTNLKEKEELTGKGNKSRALQNSYASRSRKEEHSYSSKEHVKEKKIVNDTVGLSGNYDVSNDDNDGSDHSGDSDGSDHTGDRMETKEEINDSKPETEENDVEIIDTDEETNDGTISCDHCSKTFHTRQQLRSHKLTVAMSVIKKRYEIKKSFSKIDCKSEISNMDSDVKPEDSLIKNEGEIKIKKKRQKGQKFAKAMCELCGQVFKYPRSLMYHLRDKICQKERPTKCIPRRIRMFTCEKCGVQVKGYSAFVRHKEVAHTLRFVCRYCGKVWAYEYQRIEHEKRHRGERTLKCDLCDYMGVSTFEVKQHKKRAHNNMQFPCPNCSKVFHAEADRRNHIRRIHMREKSFTCDHCPYTAHCAYYLRNHIERVHNKDEEAQFPCTVCGKLLSSFSSLRRHLRNVHKTDPPMKTPRLIRQMQQAETGNDQLESSEGLVNIEVSEDQIEHVFVESTPLQTFSQTTPTVTVPYQQGLPIETVNYEKYWDRRELHITEGSSNWKF